MTSWEFIPKMHYKIITMIKKTKIRKVLIFGLDLIKLST